MDLTLNDFVLGVLLAALISVAIFGAFSRLLHWKRERELKRLVTVCRLCGHVFLNQQDVKLVRCKACDAANLRKGNGKLG